MQHSIMQRESIHNELVWLRTHRQLKGLQDQQTILHFARIGDVKLMSLDFSVGHGTLNPPQALPDWAVEDRMTRRWEMKQMLRRQLC
jgi:hypothetical protein